MFGFFILLLCLCLVAFVAGLSLDIWVFGRKLGVIFILNLCYSLWVFSWHLSVLGLACDRYWSGVAVHVRFLHFSLVGVARMCVFGLSLRSV